MHNVFIGLGSNIGDRLKYLHSAVKVLSDKGLIPIKTSCVYESVPYQMESDSNFYNAVILCETKYTVKEVLKITQDVETLIGRKKSDKGKSKDRVIDLDILFYEAEIIKSSELIVPHKEITKRDFVLKPLNDIAPDFRHPVFNKTLDNLLEDMGKVSCKNIGNLEF